MPAAASAVREQYSGTGPSSDQAASAGEPRLSVLLGSLADDPGYEAMHAIRKGQARRIGVGQVERRLDFIAGLFQIAR